MTHAGSFSELVALQPRNKTSTICSGDRISGPHEWCAITSLLMEKNFVVVLNVLVEGDMAGHGPLPGVLPGGLHLVRLLQQSLMYVCHWPAYVQSGKTALFDPQLYI